jgi:alpha-glucoside transport system substrate-binding protein
LWVITTTITAISQTYPGLSPIVDYNFFEFPEIDPAMGDPLVGGGDFVILFHATTGAQSLVQFLSTPDAAEIWAARGGGYLAANNGVDPNIYPDDLTRAEAQQLVDASDFVFDLDDQLPQALQSYLWGALMDFVAHQGQLQHPSL